MINKHHKPDFGMFSVEHDRFHVLAGGRNQGRTKFLKELKEHIQDHEKQGGE